ncbi:hypothetical protein CRYUN_Cryun01aG0230000 [Craigia yunnanensis]
MPTAAKKASFMTFTSVHQKFWNHTKATMTLNGFGEGEEGGGQSECDNKYHSDKELVVALSTGWFNKKKRCLKFINIYGNGKSVQAKVVDECDSKMGCDTEHSYQPPCNNNIVDASDAVWRALGVPADQWGEMDIYCGELKGTAPLPEACNTEDSSACCAEGEIYNIYDCSPHVSSRTKANLTLKSFDRGGNSGGPSECDNQRHSDELVVALSTGWFDNGNRCNRYINISGNGKNVTAKVVDQCDSRMGCDSAHKYEPPCGNSIVRASKAVWYALGVPQSQWSRLGIHWSDA